MDKGCDIRVLQCQPLNWITDYKINRLVTVLFQESMCMKKYEKYSIKSTCRTGVQEKSSVLGHRQHQQADDDGHCQGRAHGASRNK